MGVRVRVNRDVLVVFHPPGLSLVLSGSLCLEAGSAGKGGSERSSDHEGVLHFKFVLFVYLLSDFFHLRGLCKFEIKPIV